MRDAVEHRVQYGSHALVHRRGIVAFEREGLIAVAAHQFFELMVRDAREDGGVGDLVAVQVKNRQHGTVGGWIEEFVGMPAGGEGAGLGFSVADDAGDEQVWVVEGRAKGVDERVTEFAALMNRTRRLRGDMAWNAQRPAELAKETLDAVGILLDGRKEFRVGAFQIGIGDNARTAVPGPDDVHHVEVALIDGAIEVHVEKIEAGGRTPMAEESRLDVLERKGLLKQWIVFEIDLANGEIVGGPPIGIHFGQKFRG